MGKIKKIKSIDLVGGVGSEDIYPITATKAVYDENNKNLNDLLSSLNSAIETVRDTSTKNSSSIIQETSRAKTAEKLLENKIESIKPYINVSWDANSNINQYLDTGVYNITGPRLNKEDNLPIDSVGIDSTINATLTVLDSTINVLGGIDGGACITQILSISDRVGGEGNVYIRTGRGSVKIPDAISWDSWSVQTTITDVGVVKDEQHSGSSGWLDGKGMNSLGKAGFYRGLYFDNKNREESFFLLVIDSSPAINAEVSVFNYVTQIKYGLPINGGGISLKVRMGLPKQNDLGGFIEGEFDWGEWKDFVGDSTPTVTWQGQNLNDYTTAGVYNIQGNRVSGDNMPILNEGVISARLTVLSTDDGAGNTVVTQVLSLNNNSGGEGNVYVRSAQKGSWSPWGKLQTNVEVGQVNTLDNLTDNGMYSGVLITDTGFDTFVLVVINNYAAAVPAGFGWYVAQLKYSLGLDGSVTVKTRKMDYTNSWSEWEELKGGSTGGSPYTAIIPKDAKISSYSDGDVFFCLGSNFCELEGKTFTFPAFLNGRSSIVTRLNGSWHLRAFNTSIDTAYEEYVLADRNRGWKKINGAVGGGPYTDTVEQGIITSNVIGKTFLCLGTENSFRFVSSGTEYPIPTTYGILTILGASSAHLRGFASTKNLYKEYIIPEEGTHIDSWQEVDNETIIYDTTLSDNYNDWTLGSFVPNINSRCIILGGYYDKGDPPVKLISQQTCWCFLENKEDRILDITFLDDKGTNLNISTHLIIGTNNVSLIGASISGRIGYDCQFNVPLIFDNVAIGIGASVAIYKKDGTVGLIDVGAGCNLRSIGLDINHNTLIKEYIENGEVKQEIID